MSSEGAQLQKQEKELPDVWSDLEPKYRRFAILYAEHLNFTTVANELSLTPKTCRNWSRIPAVAALVNHYLKRFEEHSLVNKQYKEAVLLQVIDIGLGEENTYGIDKEGGGYSEKITNLPAVNQAVATLNRMETDRASIRLKEKGKGDSGTVIVNIEQANFGSNQHFDLLNKKNSVDVDTGVVIEHE